MIAVPSNYQSTSTVAIVTPVDCLVMALFGPGHRRRQDPLIGVRRRSFRTAPKSGNDPFATMDLVRYRGRSYAIFPSPSRSAFAVDLNQINFLIGRAIVWAVRLTNRQGWLYALHSARAARIHHDARWSGWGVAACGARAAAQGLASRVAARAIVAVPSRIKGSR